MKKQKLLSLCRDLNGIHDCTWCPYEFTDTCKLRLEDIEKEQKIREKIEFLVRVIADRKRWGLYDILILDVILDNDSKFAEAYITVNYRDESGINEQMVSKFNKITQKDILSNAKIY